MTDYPWFKNYDPGVPRTLGTYPAGTLLDTVDAFAGALAAAPA